MPMHSLQQPHERHALAPGVSTRRETPHANIRLILIHDQRLMREALRQLLAMQPGIEVTGEAGAGREALRLAQRLVPDIAVFDVALPDKSGAELVRQLQTQTIKAIALSSYTDQRFVAEMLRAGVAGYVDKSAGATELINAIRAVGHNKTFLSPNALRAVVAHCQADVDMGISGRRLGRRERQVLALLAGGKRSGEIARLLAISFTTVEVHRRNIMRKLDLHTVAELTKHAIRTGLTSL